MDSLVSTDQLAAELERSDIVVLDATMHLPDTGRDAQREFEQAHIPGARFLDLESFIDTASEVPKAVPTAKQFAARLGALGISPTDRVVLYDDSHIRSAARAWFLFRLYGFDGSAVLDGGFAKWRSENRPAESGPVRPEAVEFPVPRMRAAVRSKAEMLANCETRTEQIVDARDAARFAGAEGSGSEGHIPGARNVPFTRLFGADGTYRDPEALVAEFRAEGIDLSRPITTSCNSGMTAAVLLFGLHLAGKEDAALYDGSWLEWGGDPATPKEKGAAR